MPPSARARRLNNSGGVPRLERCVRGHRCSTATARSHAARVGAAATVALLIGCAHAPDAANVPPAADAADEPAHGISSLDTNRPTAPPGQHRGRTIAPFHWMSPAELAGSAPKADDSQTWIIERLTKTERLRPDITVADVGAGRGTLALLMAGVVGARGRVYAVEIQPALVGYIAGRASERGV